MEATKYDDLFFSVLKEEGQLLPFLNAVFGFLYRRTDFYCIQEDPKGKLGFPIGVAERIVLNVLRKWEQVAHPPQPSPNFQSDELPDMSQLVVNEVEIETTVDIPEEKCVSSSVKTEDPSSDIYNGADCGSYRWSQSIQDIDIQIPVSQTITKASDVKVDVQSQRIVVHTREEGTNWHCLVDGEMIYRNRKDDSIWSLVPGKHIIVHLEKTEERWWDALLTTEPQLDLKLIDAAQSINDLPQDEQMKIEELMWNEERKRQGLPSSQEMEVESLLKKAWDVKGSPFRGTPFDPKSVITDHQT